jgi:phosphopentomutase
MNPAAPPSSAAHRRAIVIVLDGVGCGELPDADDYGDRGSNTLGNLSRSFADGLSLPRLASLGLGRILELRGVVPCEGSACRGSFGRCAEVSPGKDSTTGHWEMAGVVLDRPFPTYPDGFPPEVIELFCLRIGRGVLGNKAASGTEIIQELGEEHVRTGKPIVYTSADSVFQIAAHESVIPPDDLYAMCRVAREVLQGPHAVGRIIARPFTGEAGRYVRTPRRHDFSLPPRGVTVLDRLTEAGIATIGIGKIGDLFAHRGLGTSIPTAANADGIERTIRTMETASAPSMIFTNLVEFDQTFGHRNDTVGYRAALEAFDARLPEIFAREREGDLLLITGDHGVDPTTPGTDHTREYTPLLVWGPAFRTGIDLGTRSTFADIGQTLCDYFGVPPVAFGQSFLRSLLP